MPRRALNAQFDWYLGGTLVTSFNKPRSEAYPKMDIIPWKGVGGWRSNPDADNPEAEEPAGRIGEQPYPRASRGKTLTFNNRIKAQTEEDLEEFRNAMSGAFQNISDVGLLIASPWPGVGDGDQWATYARLLDYDDDDAWTFSRDAVPSPFQCDPILSFRQVDGRWIYWNETGTPGEALHYENLAGNNVVVDNAGTAPAEPLITILGVADGTDVHIGRDIPGGGTQDLWFRDPGAGDLFVDFPNHSASIGGVDVSDTYDASSSDWWDEFTQGVPPGSHNLWKGPGAGTGIAVDMYTTSW